jgi:hypothetical protein
VIILLGTRSRSAEILDVHLPALTSLTVLYIKFLTLELLLQDRDIIMRLVYAAVRELLLDYDRSTKDLASLSSLLECFRLYIQNVGVE